MLVQRIGTGIILFGMVYWLLFFAHPTMFMIVAAVLCGMCCYELLAMYKFSIKQSVAFLLMCGVITLCMNVVTGNMALQKQWDILFLYINSLDIVMRVVIVGVWCFLVPLVLVYQPIRFSKFAICGIAVVIFLPALYALLMLHKYLLPVEMLVIMSIAWVADIGAYFIGRLIGRHKLAVTISPGKTIEGAVAGGILVMLYLLLLKYFCPSLTFLHSYIAVIRLAIILTLASILGDLFESWLKRVAAVKDSGSLLPGHGGLFDRLDSLLAVVAVGYVMLFH